MFKGIISLILILLLLVVPVFAFRDVTGFVSGRYNERKQTLNLVLDQSQKHTFDIYLPESTELVSIKLGGKVIGEGEASAFLEHEDRMLKIFAYNEKKSTILNFLTGLFSDVENALTGSAVLDLGSNATKITFFDGQCIDTCYLNLGKKEKIDIVFVIESDTTLELSHLDYQYIYPSPQEQTPFRRFLSKVLNIFE